MTTAAPHRCSDAADRTGGAAPPNCERPAKLFLAIVCLLIFGHDIVYSRGLAGDSFHHLMNGIFVHDALCQPRTALHDPMGFWGNYYTHFPAVNLGYYPPVFAVVEGLLMFIFGVSALTGQITVLLFAFLLTERSFAWFRLRFSVFWAAIATVIFISTPLLVFYGRDIMLEVPVMALVMAAMTGFEQAINSPRPRWRDCAACGVCTALAIWTKQPAIMLIGIYAVTLLITRRLRLLITPPLFVAAITSLLAAGALVFVTLKLGGTNVAHSVGFTPQHVVDRFNIRQWTFYLTGLPRILGRPLLVLSGLGLLIAVIRRDRGTPLLLVWIVVFYVMHSDFKAQELRYGCLWMPPFVALAVMAIREICFGSLARRKDGGAAPLAGLVGIGFATYCFVGGFLVQIPRVPDGFGRIAAELRDRMPPFSCLTFVPDRPGRLPVNYRLALENRPTDKSIYSYGCVLRAGQIYSAAPDQWHDVQSLLTSLAEWNINYLVLTRPLPAQDEPSDGLIAKKLEEVVASGEFIEIGRYSLNNFDGINSRRSMFLYERKKPLEFNSKSRVPLLTHRIPTSITASNRSNP